MNFRIITPLLACILFLLSSCGSRYSKYNADWIVLRADFEGKNVNHIITFFNFTINVKTKTARPCDISFTDEFVLSEAVPIKFDSRDGIDYLEIKNHYNLNGRYQIQCLDENCCTISLSNEKFYLEMTYNSEIPYGRKRDCPMPSEVMDR